MTHNKTNISILKNNKNTHSQVSESQIHNKLELKGPGPQNPKRKNREKGKGRRKGGKKKESSQRFRFSIQNRGKRRAKSEKLRPETGNEKPRQSKVIDRAARDS